eukprot:1870956-Rhodomonas_salina.1
MLTSPIRLSALTACILHSGVEKICQTLRASPSASTLTSLSLSHNNIGDEVSFPPPPPPPPPPLFLSAPSLTTFNIECDLPVAL